MKRTIQLGLVALIAVMSLGAEKKVPVIRVAQFMTDPNLIQIMSDTARDIEKRHPELKIRIENIPYNEYIQKVTTQYAGGNAPDVIFSEVNNFVELYKRGVFEDLTPYCKKDKINLKGYYPGVIGRFSPDGGLFAIPQDTAPEGLIYYNKKIFQEAGVPFPDGKWKWPGDFVSVCQKLVKKDAKGKIVRYAFNDAYPVRVQNFLHSAGGDWVDDTAKPTRLTLDSPAALQAFQFRYDLIHKYHFSPSPAELQTFSAASGAEDMFMNGQIAMMTSGIWHTPKFLKKKDLDFDVTTFPKGPGGKGWSTGGSGYALAKIGKNKDLAWTVIKEITSPETLTKMAATGMIQPAFIKMAESDTFKKAPGAANKGILLKMPRYAHYGPFLANWNEIYWGNLNPVFDRFWNGDQEPKDALPKLNADINKKFFSKK